MITLILYDHEYKQDRDSTFEYKLMSDGADKKKKLKDSKEELVQMLSGTKKKKKSSGEWHSVHKRLSHQNIKDGEAVKLLKIFLKSSPIRLRMGN